MNFKEILLYAFDFLGIIIFLSGVFKLVKIREYEKSTAEITDEIIEERHKGGDYERARFPVYTYKWQGETRTRKANTSSNKPIGTTVTIYIDNDGNFHEVREGVFLVVFGILWSVGCTLVLIFGNPV